MKKRTLTDGPPSEFARWYKKNRKQIADARAERRANDPEYLKRERELRRLSAVRTRSKQPPTREEITRFVEVRGQRVPVLTRIQVARLLGRPREALVRWEELGVLPRALYTAGGTQARLYTYDQALMLQASAKEAGLAPGMPGKASTVPLAKFAELVKARWAQMPGGVGGWR